ncbi:hypothetical protein N184_27275 [Sinorhizobium sp. GL28]|nr:hypothetical protein N184_27275 [Sinorhizobium sp. GL28]
MMCQHRPEPPEGFGRDSRAELGDVALQVCSYEVLPPTRAGPIVDGEKAVREASSDPERVDILIRYLEAIDWVHLKISDPTGKSFAGLLQQVYRRRTQQEKLPRSFA